MDRKYKVLDIQKWRFSAFLSKNRRIPALSAIILAEYGHFQHLQHDSVISAVMSLMSFSGPYAAICKIVPDICHLQPVVNIAF